MDQISEGIWVSQDDAEIIAVMEGLRENRGMKIPEIRNDDPNMIWVVPMVGCTKGQFSLTLFQYASKEGDSGYIMTHIENFLTKNVVNLKDYSRMSGVKAEDLLAEITKQTKSIAEKAGYTLHISAAISEDFIGLMATADHPVEMVTNSQAIQN